MSFPWDCHFFESDSLILIFGEIWKTWFCSMKYIPVKESGWGHSLLPFLVKIFLKIKVQIKEAIFNLIKKQLLTKSTHLPVTSEDLSCCDVATLLIFKISSVISCRKGGNASPMRTRHFKLGTNSWLRFTAGKATSRLFRRSMMYLLIEYDFGIGYCNARWDASWIANN